MDILIRPEHRADHHLISELILTSFAEVEISDHQEAKLVQRLRNSKAYVPSLALIALVAEEIVGYILFTKIRLKGFPGEGLALAPLCVLPLMQNKGVGSKLVQFALKMCERMKFAFVTVIGDPDYYSRFGFRPGLEYGIIFPFDVPSKYCMVLPLITGTDIQSGLLVFPDAFWNHN